MKTLATFFSAVTLVFLAVSCQSPMKLNENQNGQAGSLTIVVPTSHGRSILPSSVAITSYLASGTGPSGAVIPPTSSATGSFTFTNLALGLWTINVTALDSLSNLIATGSTTVTVASGTTNATIQLVPATGSGAVSISASWPSDKTLDDVSGTLTPNGGSALPVAFTIAGPSAGYSANLAAGSYVLIVNFKSGGVVVAAPRTETVLVYNANTSNGGFTLTDSDFSGFFVTYDGNGSTNGSPPVDSNNYLHGGAVTVGLPGSLTKSGCTFAGWNTASDGTGVNYAPNATFPMPGASITLYAFWMTGNLSLSIAGNNITLTAVAPAPTGTFSVPNGITVVGPSVFTGDTGLTVVSLPASVTAVGASAFYDCSGLTSINLTSSVTTIGNQSFEGCTSLTNITIPSSVDSIGSNAFQNCGLTTLTFMPGVTSIGSGAFLSCNGLTSVTIPASVTSIGSGVFVSCFGLTNIGVAAGNTAYQSIGGVLYNLAGTTLVEVPNALPGSSFAIPNGVTTIAASAFQSCTSLTSITFPSTVASILTDAFASCATLNNVILPPNVTSIGNFAFSYCGSLTSLTMAGNTPPSLGPGVFSNTPAGLIISVPAGYAATYQTAANWSAYAAQIQ